MNPVLIAEILSALASITEKLAPVVQQAMTVANSDDAASIKASIAQLQTANDSLYANVQDELRG